MEISFRDCPCPLSEPKEDQVCQSSTDYVRWAQPSPRTGCVLKREENAIPNLAWRSIRGRRTVKFGGQCRAGGATVKSGGGMGAGGATVKSGGGMGAGGATVKSGGGMGAGGAAVKSGG